MGKEKLAGSTKSITVSESDRMIDLVRNFIVLRADGSLESKAQSAGAPPRIDGHSIGIWETDRPAPHNGEMHPDGDELIIVIEGAIIVKYDGHIEVPIEQGEAHIVRRGVWHRVIPQGRCRLLYLTPGPNGEFRTTDDAPRSS
jgi:mannose-6-phosphate isomerase-like protein (cupin superfamily)